MLKKIHYTKNKLFEVEFFQNEECTVPFDFTNAKNLYIELVNGNITPIMFLYGKIQNCNLFIPFLPSTEQIEVYSLLNSVLHARGIKLYTLSSVGDVTNRNACIDNTSIFSITTNLSKYIPEDNAVLFLDGEKISLCDYDEYYNMFSGYRDIEFEGKILKGMPYHPQIYGIHTIGDRVYVHKHEYDIDDYTNFTLNILKNKKLTIFLPHGTQAELQKANEVSKYLWENFGIKPDLFGLHWFVEIKCDENIDDELPYYTYTYFKGDIDIDVDCIENWSINKIITTNSTGILKPEDSKEGLQVIDCFDIFQDHLNNI